MERKKKNLPSPSNVKSSWKIPLGFQAGDNPLCFLALPSGLTAPPTGLGLVPSEPALIFRERENMSAAE